MGLRRRDVRPYRRRIRQPGSRRHRHPQLPLAAGSGGRRAALRRSRAEAVGRTGDAGGHDHHWQRFRRAPGGRYSLSREVFGQVFPPHLEGHRSHRASGGSAGLCSGGHGRRRVVEGGFTMKAKELSLAAVHPGSIWSGEGRSGRMPPLAGATGWLNSPPFTADDLQGKVVLIDFWTYTCINWLRTLPYVRAWAEKYKDHGLVMIGVHTPEFPFEKNIDNVRRAARDRRVEYPVALDSDYAIWEAFENHYWPALYFVDAQGMIRHHQFGEGDYDESERVIQRLLAGAGMDGVDKAPVSVEGQGAEAAADWASLRSAENYLGYERTENFASPGGAAPEERRVYAVPERLPLNHWALAGEWTVQPGAVRLNQAKGRVA